MKIKQIEFDPSSSEPDPTSSSILSVNAVISDFDSFVDETGGGGGGPGAGPGAGAVEAGGGDVYLSRCLKQKWSRKQEPM